MVFALLDYINYVSMKGNYSLDNISKNGGELCSRENIEAFIRRSKPLDIILLHTRLSLMSWLVMYYTNSIWSHTSGVVRDNYLIEATLEGVIKVPISSYIDDKSYYGTLRLRDEITPDMAEKGLRFAEESVGNGFNWFGIFRIFLRIIFGRSKDWRLKHSLDIFITILLLRMLNISTTRTSLGISIVYSTILVINLLLRKHSKN